MRASILAFALLALAACDSGTELPPPVPPHGELPAPPEPVEPPAPVEPAYVVWDGNSLVSGQNLNAETGLVGQAARLLGPGYDALTNLSISGQKTSDMLADAETEVDPLYSASNPRPQVLVAWEGTNEALYSDAQRGYELLADYCRGRRAAGWRVVTGTLLPRADPVTPPEFEARRQEINRLLRLNWPSFADGLFDPAADARLGRPGAPDDRTWYQEDRVHLNADGAGIVARLAAAEVQRLAGADEPLP